MQQFPKYSLTIMITLFIFIYIIFIILFFSFFFLYNTCKNAKPYIIIINTILNYYFYQKTM